MSRIGKKPVSLPDKVTLSVSGDRVVTAKGPKGELTFPLPAGIELSEQDGSWLVERSGDSPRQRALHGTVRAVVNNLVTGVSAGFTKDLEIVGVGFRAAVKGKDLDLSVGYSHPVLEPIPDGITVTVNENTKIKIEGIDKHKVGQFAADVRSWYPPEPYKGKGIRYAGEQVRRKEGKSVK